MADIWEELNDRTPEFFKDIINKYNLHSIKLNKLNTALVCDEYALIIGVDRFHVDIEYITRNEDNILNKYMINNFFAERYDEKDRQNLVVGNGARETIINNFIIISQGLQNKWTNVLEGNKEWINTFKKSKWFEVSNIREYELCLGKEIH